MPAQISAEMRAKASSPEARRKAIATFRRTMAKKKAAQKGTTDTLNVADLQKILPKRTKPARKGRRRKFTEAEKRAYVQRVEAAIAKGASKGKAFDNIGISHTQFYAWQKEMKRPEKTMKAKKLNGATHEAVRGSWVVRSVYDREEEQLLVLVHIDGVEHIISVGEARAIYEGLAQMRF